MRPRLIAIDIDGTLLGGDGRVSQRNRAALLAAERSGLEVVIATGRRHSYAMRVLRDLDLRKAGVLISSNGTVIRTIGAELISRRHMPLGTALWLCREVENFRESLVLTFDKVGEDGEDRRGALVCERTDALHTSIGSWMRANEPYIKQVERMEHALRAVRGAGSAVPVAVAEADDDDDHTGAPIQAMLCGTIGRMAEAEALLAAHETVAGVGQPERPGSVLALHRTVYPDRDLAILDILPAGCSKASALAELARMRGCTLADVMAIGDNWNDLPMLEAAGQAVLMGNAPLELLERATELGWTVAPTNLEDGVAIAIEAVLA